MNQTFPASEKLKSKILIDRLFSEGKSVNQFPVKLVYTSVEKSEKPQLKVGVSVPKRNFKKAVARNHLKRLLRECYRKNKYLVEGNMQHSYAFMFIYTGKEPEDYHHLFSIMERLLNKFLEKENKATT